MTRKSNPFVLIALALIAFSSMAQAQAGASKPNEDVAGLERETQELSIKIEKLLYLVPPAFDLADVTQRARVVAKASEIERFEMKSAAGERLKLADGSSAPIELHRLEVSGRGPYGGVLAFFHRMGNLSRLVVLETLRLKVEAGNVVRFTAGLAFPIYADSPDPAAPLPRDVASAYRDLLRKLQTKHRLLTDLTERSQPRLAAALAAFDNLNRERATALTELQAGDEVVLKGVVAGPSARDGLKPTLAKAGFRVNQVRTSPAGACQAFIATVQLKAGDVPWDYVPGNGLFDSATADFCAAEPVSGRVTARGAATSPDALTLHLHGVRLSDVFFVLNDLTAASFLLDPSLKERVSVDVEGTTLEETLAAMSSVGVAVSPGPLHRVSRAPQQPAATAPKTESYTGERIDLLVRNAELKLILCTMSMVLQKPIWVPRKLESLVTAYSKDLPADQVLDGLLATAGLIAVKEEDRILVGPGPETQLRSQPSENACPPPADESKPVPATDYSSHLWSLNESLPHLATGDLDLAGLASTKGTWKAYVYTPSRRLMSLIAGQELSGAKVGAVGPTGVSYTTGSSAVEVPLYP
ncbi:MAG TPA: hypothetical protein VF173_27125 [Thermoanaerobaculia bacterium]|nr:hypothetical protein [Thermoanaerobaculia bacterium]